MLTHYYKGLLSFARLFLVLFVLAGCADLGQYASTTSLQLSPAQEARVGTAVEEKLIQMLGGPYHNKALADDLDQLGRDSAQHSRSFVLSVADQSTSALYPLPGGRAVITRGLLSEMSSQSELSSLMAHADYLSKQVYINRVPDSISKATQELLSVQESVYNPDSTAIRLANWFEQQACEQDCLATVQQANVADQKTDLTVLPESFRRLADLQAGYELLIAARKYEKAGDQAQAIATYLQAAAAATDEPRILGSLGLAYLRAGQLQPARLHLQKAVKRQPDYYRTLMGLGYLYAQQGNYRKANKALAGSVRLLPVTENLFLLAEATEKSGDIEGAASLYRLVVESDSNSKLGRAAARRLAETAGEQ